MRAVLLERFFPGLLFVTSLTFASLLGGCGPEMSNPSAMTADRSAKAVGPREEESRGSPTASEIFRGRKAGANGSAGIPTGPESRLEALREQIDGGADPATVEILYASLSDPEPKVREAVAEWLRLFVEQDTEARAKVEALQRREPSREVWHQTAELLAPREEQVEDPALPEETE